MLFCRTSNKSISVPQEIIKYPNFTALHDPTEKLCPFYIYENLLSNGSTSFIVKNLLLYSILLLPILTIFEHL